MTTRYDKLDPAFANAASIANSGVSAVRNAVADQLRLLETALNGADEALRNLSPDRRHTVMQAAIGYTVSGSRDQPTNMNILKIWGGQMIDLKPGQFLGLKWQDSDG